MSTFLELARSRREWIDQVLQPWCASAARKELLQAEHEWNDVAGKVDPNKTLWFWAWSRFPELVNVDLKGIDETSPVCVELHSGETLVGYPDARDSLHGELVLICRDPANPRQTVTAGPYPLDAIRAVSRPAARG